jgi:hypothetical protein
MTSFGVSARLSLLASLPPELVFVQPTANRDMQTPQSQTFFIVTFLEIFLLQGQVISALVGCGSG